MICFNVRKKSFLRIFRTLLCVCIIAIFSPLSYSQELTGTQKYDSQEFDAFYKNPKVINVEYRFELNPGSLEINDSEDLKVWIPLPRDWDTQKVVEVSKIEPKCDKDYYDPEHGNRILFWDFNNHPTDTSYKITICYRIENYQTYPKDTSIFSSVIPYNKNSKEFKLYTKSTNRVNITPQIIDMAKEAIGDETNPYLQSKAIFQYVSNKMKYKMHRKDRGVGTDVLLKHPKINKESGEKYYEGACGQFHALFVALCRVNGIPARPISGFIQGATDIKEKELKVYRSFEYELSPNGLAGTQHYFRGRNGMSALPHVWAEFYLSGYGWIPVDLNIGPTFGYLKNPRVVLSKGFDVLLSSDNSPDEFDGYGFQWIPIVDGRVDVLWSGVWKISKLRDVSVKIFYQKDPFPSEGYFKYVNNLIPEFGNNGRIDEWERQTTRRFFHTSLKSNGNNIFEINPELKKDHEAYLCQLLHHTTGNEAFKTIGNSYINLRLISGKPVAVEEFQRLVDSNVSNNIQIKEWISGNALPIYKFKNIELTENKNNWTISGYLLQENPKYYDVPFDIAIHSSKGEEIHTIQSTSDTSYINISTTNLPKKLVFDPHFHLPTIRWMPPLLEQLWGGYPNFIVIYGSIKEAEENRNTAMKFINEFAGLSPDLVKKDTEVTKEDLSKERIILIGRPETNVISKKFEKEFPIKFNGSRMMFKGQTYSNPSMGVAQIVENKSIQEGMLIMYAGLSGVSTETICDKNNWMDELNGYYAIDCNSSFIIFDNYKLIQSGEWEDSTSDLVWSF